MKIMRTEEWSERRKMGEFFYFFARTKEGGKNSHVNPRYKLWQIFD